MASLLKLVDKRQERLALYTCDARTATNVERRDRRKSHSTARKIAGNPFPKRTILVQLPRWTIGSCNHHEAGLKKEMKQTAHHECVGYVSHLRCQPSLKIAVLPHESPFPDRAAHTITNTTQHCICMHALRMAQPYQPIFALIDGAGPFTWNSSKQSSLVEDAISNAT